MLLCAVLQTVLVVWPNRAQSQYLYSWSGWSTAGLPCVSFWISLQIHRFHPSCWRHFNTTRAILIVLFHRTTIDRVSESVLPTPSLNFCLLRASSLTICCQPAFCFRLLTCLRGCCSRFACCLRSLGFGLGFGAANCCESVLSCDGCGAAVSCCGCRGADRRSAAAC
jgi:hypothetical protein